MRTLIRKLKQITFLSFIFIATLAFNFQDNPPSNWIQQFLPNIGSRQITDMTFKDSLTGYAVATTASDTSYVLKTTDGGDNWQVVFRNFFKTTNIQFLNKDTGYVCGSYIYKTTNGGINWILVNNGGISSQAMYVLNQDTIWVVLSESLTGGIFRTTNGGLNWTQQLSAGIYNPTNIYFYNKNLGFAANSLGGKLYRTTNAGENWTQVLNEGFRDMHFFDSLTGWKSLGTADSSMKKTTDGGLNWVKQKIPYGGYPNVLSNGMVRFTVMNKDTLWGVGGNIYFSAINKGRGILYHTTNGGANWTYQIPDTSINIAAYYHINNINKNNIWAYTFSPNMGIHTTTGGDTTFISSVKQLSTEIPSLFKLSQNYPNPFNPNTKISFKLRVSSYISLKVFNVKGQEVASLVNDRKSAGTYEAEFNASEYNLSSGIYFYTLTANYFIDTKKMILVK